MSANYHFAKWKWVVEVGPRSGAMQSVPKCGLAIFPSSSILHSHIGSNGRPVGNGEGQDNRYSRTKLTFTQHLRPGPAARRLTDRRQPRLVHT